MGFFNPVGQRIQFLEETLTPLPPQVISDTIVFDLSEAVTVPALSPVVSDTITFDITESMTVTT